MILVSNKSPIDIFECRSEINKYLSKSNQLIKNEQFVKAGICKVNNINCFIKKYISRGFIHSVKNFVRESKAEKNYRISEYLFTSNVNYPHVYGVMKKGNIFTGFTVFLIMEVINEAGVDDFYRNVIYADKSNLFNYMIKVAQQINSLHKVNFYHGDTKRSNFYIDGNADNYKIGVLDFDGSKIYSSLPLKKKARDLGRFIASVMEEQNKYRKKYFDIYEVMDLILSKYKCIEISEELIRRVLKDAKYHLRRKKLVMF